jgi:hypothetical protein
VGTETRAATETRGPGVEHSDKEGVDVATPW